MIEQTRQRSCGLNSNNLVCAFSAIQVSINEKVPNERDLSKVFALLSISELDAIFSRDPLIIKNVNGRQRTRTNSHAQTHTISNSCCTKGQKRRKRRLGRKSKGTRVETVRIQPKLDVTQKQRLESASSTYVPCGWSTSLGCLVNEQRHLLSNIAPQRNVKIQSEDRSNFTNALQATLSSEQYEQSLAFFNK